MIGHTSASGNASVPFAIHEVHMVGIGGIGMSGIAELLAALGYQVRGSDVKDSPRIEALRSKGIEIHIGHDARHIHAPSVVVNSSAVQADNPELQQAHALGIPVIPRADMLAELMRFHWSVAVAGTHGKTTTASLLAHLLHHAGLDPTIVNGGIINAWQSNVRLGQGSWMVVEADESDGSFLKLPATVAVVTNIDEEHMDYYQTPQRLHAAFRQFVDSLPFYGFAAVCLEGAPALVEDVLPRRIRSYGFDPRADVRALNVRPIQGGRMAFEVTARTQGAAQGVAHGAAKNLGAFELAMQGEHNVLNALAAVTVGLELQLSPHSMAEALKTFTGVNRRFTLCGHHSTPNGLISVYDDYAHHPVEIAATLKAARQGANGSQILAVMQPHRYSRLQDLMARFAVCFDDADHVVITPVHAAGEAPVPGCDQHALMQAVRDVGHPSVVVAPGETAALAQEILRYQQHHPAPACTVVCLGAGSITQWAHDLPAQLARHP